jgi:hypothetical protein
MTAGESPELGLPSVEPGAATAETFERPPGVHADEAGWHAEERRRDAYRVG